MTRFQFVADHQDAFEVKRLCELVEIERSSYYAWKAAAPGREARAAADAELAERGCQMTCVNGRVRRRAGCACSWKETYPYVRPEADLEVQDRTGA